MIVVRDVFQLKFGKAREAIAIMRDAMKVEDNSRYRTSRVLVDLTGDYYQLVMESEFESLGDFETALQEVTSSSAWREIYSRFTPLVQSGRREVFRIVDSA